ncbi:MAG: hypothetical protein ABSA13_16550 [Beijerinckiaceae bacterium]
MPTILPIRAYVSPWKQFSIPLWVIAPIALGLLSLGLAMNPLTQADPDSALFETLAASP